MRTDDEIRQVLEHLEQYHQRLIDDYNQFIDFQGNKHLRDERLSLPEAARKLNEDVLRLQAVWKTINVLQWVTGKYENLPWW